MVRIVSLEEGARFASFSCIGDGAGKAVLQQKNTQTRFETLTGGQKMNIKSLLLGSAAAAVVATGAQAADAIVIAEPEPVEYVRVCDVYGAGFFYIPGTQNCLKIGGYMRYEARYNNDRWTQSGQARDYRYWNHARFQLNIDARNETEWGTLRSYVEGRFDWNSSAWTSAGVHSANSGSAYLHQGFIELQSGAGTVRLGKTDTAYTRFLGHGTPKGPFDGSYAYRNTTELSYHYDAGNGFSAIIAANERSSGRFDAGVEGGVKFTQGWGSVGALVGYDTLAQEWGVKGALEGNLGVFALGLKGFYASNSKGNYSTNVYSVDGRSEFSVMGYAKADVTDTLAVLVSAQYFDNKHQRNFDNNAGVLNVRKEQWQIAGGFDWRPVSGLRVRPEIRYTTKARDTSRESWEAAIRFDRSF